MQKFVQVVVDIANSMVDRAFDYLAPPDFCCNVGDVVVVPFGTKNMSGIVVSVSDQTEQDISKLKTITSKSNISIPSHLILLAKEVSGEFFLRMADVLRLFLPPAVRRGEGGKKVEKLVNLSKDFQISNIKKTATAQLKIANFLMQNPNSNYTQVANMFGGAALKKMCENGFVVISCNQVFRTPQSPTSAVKNITHTPEQIRAINSVCFNSYGQYLLHGVTGSGKTEVYMALIQKALMQNKSAIMLVPEISLTPQVAAAFRARFGQNVALLHSGLSAGEKADEWQRLRGGDAKVAVGPRSAIFAPLEDVGIIIVDEEHDQSYVSESNPRYHTKTVAVLRSVIEKCPLVLGSATPSISTYLQTQQGKTTLLQLPTRVNKKPLPPIQIVDMLGEIKQGGDLLFSQTLLNELKKVEKQKKQAMLLLNRRGYSSFFQCKECGYVAKCTSCDVSLVYHKHDNSLKCHYCGKKFKALTKCPNCHSQYIKQGAVGTEKVVAELEKLFPDVKILRMDNDSTSAKNAHQTILSEFSKTKPCFLVGTQMIAKGHDFEDVTLVGILDADQSLFHNSYVSTEKTFQLLTQMSGRAGRSESEGLVVLQTFCPKHYVFKFVSNSNYKGFYEKEISIRQATKFPPFSTILKVLISSPNETIAKQTTKELYEKAIQIQSEAKDKIIFLTASACPITKVQNRFRFQIITRIKNDRELMSKFFDLASQANKPHISVFVEINPPSLQ